MKIDPTSKITPPGVVNEERTRAGKPAEGASAKPRSEVQISPLSAQLKEIEAQLESEQAVDTARVAEVKAAIAEGRFQVDAEKVADRLIEATREFARASKQ